jgi:dynein heavy chain
VLNVAGAFKRAEPNNSEFALLMRALRDFNTPKIAFTDNYVFFGLLKDLFPGIDPPRKRDYDFEKVIEECSVSSKLYPDPDFILKVV